MAADYGALAFPMLILSRALPMEALLSQLRPQPRVLLVVVKVTTVS